MKENKRTAYFVGSFEGKLKYDSHYSNIAKFIKNYGYHVFDDINHVSVEEARSQSTEEIEKYWKLTAARNINNADIFVAEISEKSIAIGIEIGMAVSEYKPTLLLRTDEQVSSLPVALVALKSRLTILEYNDQNLEQKITKWLEKVDKGILTKFMNIGFSKSQIDLVEYIQKRDKIKSFAQTVRLVLDGSYDVQKELENLKL